MSGNILRSFRHRKCIFSFQHPVPSKLRTVPKSDCKVVVCFSTSLNNSSSTAVNLAYSLYQPKEQLSSTVPILILHGMLGSRQNWRSLGKAIAVKCNRKVYTLDARNHGESPHVDDYSYHLMSEDIKHFMSSHSISEAVIVGHSMGGRTSMYFALTNADLVKKLVVVDVGPSNMPYESTLSTSYMIAMKEAIAIVPDLSLVQARHSIDQYLSETISESGIRQFLLTNLGEENKCVKWKPNLDILLKKFKSAVLNFPSVAGYYSKETLFICGGDSTYVKPEDYPSIKKLFPKAEFIVIPGAGHWVHSEKPSEFLSALCDFL